MKAFLKKLTSRKFLAAAAGVIAGLAMVFGLDESVITTVAGAVTAVASVVTYIMTEGKVDAAAVGDAAGKVQDAVEVLAEPTETPSDVKGGDSVGVEADGE